VTAEAAKEAVRRYASRGGAVDTNLLLLLWLGGFDPAEVPRFKRTRKYAPEGFALLRDLVSPLSRLVTTPHILTELNNWAGQLPEETCANFRSAIAPIIVKSDERREAAATLVKEDGFPRLGLTDAALIRLAREGMLVITDDLPLYLYVSREQWPVIYFTHVRRTVNDWSL
jgi:hypothetical protein